MAAAITLRKGRRPSALKVGDVVDIAIPMATILAVLPDAIVLKIAGSEVPFLLLREQHRAAEFEVHSGEEP